MIHVIARAVIKEGCMEEYLKICKEITPTVRAEKGCIAYQITTDRKTGLPPQSYDASCATFIECWESEEHLKKHLQAPHMAVFREKVTPLRLSSTLTITEDA